MNSLYQQLRQPQQLPMPQQNLKSLLNNNNINILKNFLNSSDPSSFIQNMVMNNPKLQDTMQMLKTSGMTPKSFFYQYAQQKGIDPDQFINSLMS